MARSGQAIGSIERMGEGVALLVFMALVLDLAMYGLIVAGHFPAEYRSPELLSGLGRVVLWGTLLIAAGLALVAVAIAWRAVPPASAVIGGGAMLLIAPLLLRPFPDRFVNRQPALVVFAITGLAIAVIAKLSTV